MKNQKILIVSVILACVAAFAILLLVLFLTGVISAGNAEQNKTTEVPTTEASTEVLTTTESANNEETNNTNAYEYMKSAGNFYVDNAYAEDDDIFDRTYYEWSSAVGTIVIRFYYYCVPGHPESPINGNYTFDDDSTGTYLYIDDMSNFSEKDISAFENWCDTYEITPQGIMAALDQYADEMQTAAEMYNDKAIKDIAYDYLDTFGSFSVDDLQKQDSETEDKTWFVWEADDMSIMIVRSVTEETDGSLSTVYIYFDRTAERTACINYPAINDDSSEVLAYESFIAWCADHNLTPTEVMDTLSLYSVMK